MRRLLLLLSILSFITTVTVVCNRNNPSASGINITHPFMNAVLPPEFPAPLFEWWSEVKDTSAYEVSLFTDNKKYFINVVTDLQSWKPEETAWDSLKVLSNHEKIHFIYLSHFIQQVAQLFSFLFI